MKQELVSIIIPCFNQGRFLDETISSVYNQTYQNWECILVNDESTDNTEVIIKAWLKKDTRFKCIFKKNGGVSSARNVGLDHVNGKYIQFLDSDDLLDCSKLEKSLSVLKGIMKSGNQIVISNFRMLAVDSSKTFPPFCQLKHSYFNAESIIYQWNESFSIQMQCGLFHASLFQDIRFPENLTAQEDWVVWIRLFKKIPNVIFIDEVLALYRLNPTGRTTKSYYEDQIESYKHLKSVLSADEFYKLSIVLISRYYKSQEEFKKRLRRAKNSKPYQTGLMIKKILKETRLIGLFRRFFPILLKFKSK